MWMMLVLNLVIVIFIVPMLAAIPVVSFWLSFRLLRTRNPWAVLMVLPLTAGSVLMAMWFIRWGSLW
jgi:hypothetical protein